ncbi:hypothetical protein LTS08_003598 [Lithohypha guttulata]|nr:hypothetical protein LTS08_003598 [Lithohypha guttulata]
MKLLGVLAVVLLARVHAQTVVSICLSYPATITFTSYTTVYETLRLNETSVSPTFATASNSEPLATTTTVSRTFDGIDGTSTSTATFTTTSSVSVPTTTITTSQATTFSITTEDVPSTTTTASSTTTTTSFVSPLDSSSTQSISDVTRTTTATSTSSTTLVPEPQSTSVYITVGTADIVLARRAIQYVAFNGTAGHLVYDIEEAALVTLFPNGTMVFRGLYVAGVLSGNQTLLGLSNTMPTSLATWNTDDTGNVIISGTEGFCMDASTNVVVKISFTEATCTTLQLAIVAENLSVSTTPFLSSTTTSVTTSDISITTTMTSTSVSSSDDISSDSTTTSSSFTFTSSDEFTTTSTSLKSTETMTLSSSTTSSTSTTSSILISDSSTSTSTTTTTTTTTSAAPTCAVTDSSMLVVANGDIDLSAYTNLFISTTAVLNYADAPPGQNAVSIQIGTIYPQVMFENSAYLTQISCQNGMITTVVTDDFASSFVANWPQTDFIIITNSESCNSQTQRGVYLVNSHTLDTPTSTFTFSVTAAEWGAVSETMTISYGTTASSSDDVDLVYSSICTNTLSMTATTTTTSVTSSSTSLSPGAQAMLDFIKNQLAYDPEENQMLINSSPEPVVVGGGNDVVTDPELLDQLKDILQQDGLPDLDDLLDEAKDATDGSNICETPSEPPRICVVPATCNAPTIARKRPKRNANMSINALDLMPRDSHSHLEERSLEDVLEYVCSDWAEILLSPFEQIAQIQEIICGLKEAYDAAQDLYKLIKCLANPFCFNPPTVTITITYPPSTRWTYTYKWSASWSGLNGYTIVYGNPQNYIRCTDCSFSISDLTIDGAITYNVSAQTVTEARNTLRMSSVARLIMNLETNGPWTGKGTAFQSSLSLGNNQIDSMFSFSPIIVFSIGAQASANAPVSSTGGAVLSFNGAAVDLNYLNKAASNANGWQPAIQMTYPGFKNDAKINFSPVMATDIRIQMNVLKGVLNSYSAVTNQLAIGFDASYSELATSSCGAKQLALVSYVSSQGNAVFNGGAPQLLNKAVSNNPVKCYNVPQYFPTSEEISSLAQVGGDFCTSFIAYRPPISTIVTGTVTSLLSQTIETTTSVSTTTDISTSTITETLSTSLVATVSVTDRNTVSVGGGSDSLVALQKRSPPTAVPQLVRRDSVATPALVTTWENDKISYACSQIATGTKTTTLYTSTSTTYTSTSTNTVTATRFVGVDGPVASVTVTTTRYIVTSMLSSTIALADPTTVTTECPLQTQAACFKVKAHGVDLIEGQYLGTGLFPDRGFSVLGANSNPNDGIFYLDNTGKLISVMNREPMSYIQTTVALDTNGDFLGVPCNPAFTYGTPGGFPGASGCSQNCPCDRRPGGVTAICVDDIFPNSVQRIPFLQALRNCKTHPYLAHNLRQQHAK